MANWQSLWAERAYAADAVAGIVRMSELLCGGDERTCPDAVLAGGTFRDLDGMHFRHPGGRLAGEWLADRSAVFSGARGLPVP